MSDTLGSSSNTAWHRVSATYLSSSLVPGMFWRCHTSHTASFGDWDSWSLTLCVNYLLTLESTGPRAGRYSKLQKRSTQVWVAEAVWESPRLHCRLQGLPALAQRTKQAGGTEGFSRPWVQACHVHSDMFSDMQASPSKGCHDFVGAGSSWVS